MRRFVILSLVAGGVAVLCLPTNGRAEDKNAGKGPFKLSLEAVDPVVKQGAVPRLLLTVKNISDKPVQVLNVTDRPDLQHFYTDMVFTQNGKELNLSRAISDPGPFDSEKDYLTLHPGRSVAFFLTSTPWDLRGLARGSYGASVRFRNFNPRRAPKYEGTSPEVTFKVE
jgi:hypothetical protein